ncbi:unnamed protein product, partial [Amoebophrya sp. A25]
SKSQAPQESAAAMEYGNAENLESYGKSTSTKVKNLHSNGNKLQQGKNNEAAQKGKRKRGEEAEEHGGNTMKKQRREELAKCLEVTFSDHEEPSGEVVRAEEN